MAISYGNTAGEPSRFGKAPRRIFVYIAAILVYKATDTVADTEQGESRFARALKSAMTEMKRSLST